MERAAGLIGSIFVAAGSYFAFSASGPVVPTAMSAANAAKALYPLAAKTVSGGMYSFEAMKGKVGLVTNVASF